MKVLMDVKSKQIVNQRILKWMESDKIYSMFDKSIFELMEDGTSYEMAEALQSRLKEVKQMLDITKDFIRGIKNS